MLEVYRVKDLEYSHEKRQAKELIDLLNTYFKGYKNERQYIVIDPRANGLPQTEAILYFRGYTIILELKDYKRRIYPRLLGQWEAENEFGNIQLMENQVENPFHQVKRQRDKFVEFFARKVFDETAQNITGDIWHKIRKNLYAWIVTSRNSKIILGDLNASWWNKVLPLNHELTTTIYLFGKEPKNPITEKEFLRFVVAIGAVKPPLGYWNTGPVVPELEDSKSYIVEKLLQSFEEDEVKKGLFYSKELKLINNYELIKTILPRLNEDLRESSYKILFGWVKEYPNKYIGKSEELLRSALSDGKNTIRKTALEYMTLGAMMYGTEMLQFLGERLREETSYENIVLMVRALEFFQDRPLISEIIEILCDKRVFKSYYDLKDETNKIIRKKMGIVDNIEWRESEASYDLMSTIEKELREIASHINQWDNVLKAVFEVSVALGLKDIGNYSLKFFDLFYETSNDTYERYTSLTNEFRYTLNAISALKPEGATDKLVNSLHGTNDDYLKYQIIGTLGDLGDPRVVSEIYPYLSYDDEKGDIHPDHMKIQASDSLSKLGDLGSFTAIWKLYASQLGKEVRLEGDKSYLRSLRRLDRQKLEIEIWAQIERTKNLEKALERYSEAIRDCGGELSFMKLKAILIQKGDVFSDLWYSPSSTIVALPWLNPSLKDFALATGQEFLQSGKEELEYVGLELSEEHFLSNDSELERYETSNNMHTLDLIIYWYSKKGNIQKIQKFMKSGIMGVSDFAFIKLAELIPGHHYEDFHLIRGNHVYDCEFIVSDSGLALQLKNVAGHVVQMGNYVQLIPWSTITDMKSIFKDSSSVGLLFTYEGGGTKPSALVPRDVSQWNYLITKSMKFNSRMSEIVNKIFSHLKRRNALAEIVPTSDLLLSILKKAYMKEQEISNFGSVDYMNRMSSLFDEHFNEDMMRIYNSLD